MSLDLGRSAISKVNIKGRLVFLFLCFSFWVSPLMADLESDRAIAAACKNPYSYYPLIEGKVGYFRFGQHKMRKIYNKGGLDLQFSAYFPFWHYLQLYTSVEYVERHGKAKHTHQKTSIWEVPVSLGLKPTFQITSFADFYFTVGPRYFHVHINNHGSSGSTKNGIGGFVNAGFVFYFNQYIFLDLFGEYSAKKFHFHGATRDIVGHSAQVGGPTFGAGIGIRF